MKIVEILKNDIVSKSHRYDGRKFFERCGSGYRSKYKDIVDSDGKVRTILMNSNTSLDINYFKMLVNQKVNYLLSNEVTVDDNIYFTSTDITDLLEELTLNAALDTRAWLHFYIEDNKLEWIIVKDSEIIPIYDRYNKKIIGIIRYYEVSEDILRVEQWDLTGVTIETIKKDEVIETESLPHYMETIEYNDSIEDINPKNLPFIPFIPLYNNKLRLSDIDGIDSLLEMYNSINSGLIDNIYKFQEAIALFKGFSGDNQAIERAIQQMKIYKGVGVPQDGGIDYLSIEIPTEARAFLLDQIKQAIFLIGRGMNPFQNSDGGNITNVVIKARYSELDMKANSTEKQIKLFYRQFINCLNIFYSSDISYDIVLSRNQIFNESELIDDSIKSLQIVSLETALSMHPRVSNVKDELSRIKQEQETKRLLDESVKKQFSNREQNHVNNEGDNKNV